MDWRDRARAQSGVISRRQLIAIGVSSDRVDGLVQRRELVDLLPGVYVARPAPDSEPQRLWSAVLWSGGVVSHRSAAALWRVPVAASTAAVHVTVADRRFRRRARGVIVHRVPLEARDRASCERLPVTARERTIIDLLRTERPHAAADLLDRARQLGWIEEAELRHALTAHPGRTGNTRLRQLLAAIEPGADAESERRLHAILRRARLTGWIAQYRIVLGHGLALVDVAFPEHRLAIEVDGRRYHDEYSDRFESDRRRQNELMALGWRVLRFTWRMLADRPEYVAGEIKHLLAP